jgi:hypothetical protein
MSSSETKKVTLKQWIDDNERLLTVTGVFVALSAYFSQLSGIGRYLVIITFAMSLLLLVEVYSSFPKKGDMSYRLVAFSAALFALVLYMGVYFAETYRTFLLESSGIWLWIVYLLVLGLVLEKTGARKWLAPYLHRTGWKGFLWYFVVIIPIILVPALLALETSRLLTSIWPP